MYLEPFFVRIHANEPSYRNFVSRNYKLGLMNKYVANFIVITS